MGFVARIVTVFYFETFQSMDIIKRLPSQLSQYVFLFDDTYSNLNRVVMIQSTKHTIE